MVRFGLSPLGNCDTENIVPFAMPPDFVHNRFLQKLAPSALRIASKRRSNAHVAIWRVVFVLKCNDVERNLWLLGTLFN
jgi:hypothetical protein